MLLYLAVCAIFRLWQIVVDWFVKGFEGLGIGQIVMCVFCVCVRVGGGGEGVGEEGVWRGGERERVR